MKVKSFFKKLSEGRQEISWKSRIVCGHHVWEYHTGCAEGHINGLSWHFAISVEFFFCFFCFVNYLKMIEKMCFLQIK